MTRPIPIRQPVGTLEELRRIVPTEQIEAQYDGEQSAGGAWAVEPAAQVELVELLKWANQRHAAVFTRRPRRGDAERFGSRPRIYLRSRRMKRILDLDVVSGTVTVQTGITMAELHKELEERSFTTAFATRPWRQEPLGAVLAAALDAHWGPRYGAMEDQVLAVGVVFPDGTVASSKAAPRKAVGPDFDRLFIGTRGRFGILHEVTLRIHPQASRTVASFGASSLTVALEAIRRAIDLGLDPRAIELLTPAPDRSWGKKRVGLTDDLPVLVLVEPWGPSVGSRFVAPTDALLAAGGLVKLEPPIGWNVHEGLLPPPRAWTAPVVPVSFAELTRLASTLGADVPPGLWIVRMSRHGGFLSLADGSAGSATTSATGAAVGAPGSVEQVRAFVTSQVARRAAGATVWEAYERELHRRLDPKGILNPTG
ncbi:MAG: FAD-binding oxidoreductase [Deltaproteobacteria bacterium]|nr:FAD-binding oxidoreductase [Deltaproteobacteria bacterium]